MTVPTTPQITNPDDGAVVSGVITVQWTESGLPDTVAPSFIASAAAVYAPSVQSGAGDTIAPSFIASESAVFAPTVTEGSAAATVFFSDAFNGDVDGTLLQNHTPDTGTAWTKHPNAGADARIYDPNSTGGVVEGTSTSADALYHAGDAPSTADYDVEADFVSAQASTGICGRMDTAANTFYLFREFNGNWDLFKFVAGSATNLGSAAGASTGVRMKLEMRGDQITCYVDGVAVIGPVTDGDIAAAGRPGIRMRAGRLDNFEATNA